MGNCACHKDGEPEKFGSCPGDMESKTTKLNSTYGNRPLKKKKSSKKMRKAPICAVGQDIYPTVADFPTPAGPCIWTQSFVEASTRFSKDEMEEISALFHEACRARAIAAGNGQAKDYGTRDYRAETIGVDEFKRFFANYFGNVGTMMADQLFMHLTAAANKCQKNFRGPGSLGFRPLVSALHTWQHGTMRDRLILLFDMWDTEPKDGYLSMKELRHMVRATSRRHTASTVMMLEALHLDISPVIPVTADNGWGEGQGKESDAPVAPAKELKALACVRDFKGARGSIGVAKCLQKEIAVKTERAIKEERAAKEERAVKVERNMKQYADRTQTQPPGIMDNYEAEHARYESQVCNCIDDELELFIDQVFEDMDTTHDGLVSVKDWLRYASGDRNIDEFLEHFTLQIV